MVSFYNIWWYQLNNVYLMQYKANNYGAACVTFIIRSIISTTRDNYIVII